MNWILDTYSDVYSTAMMHDVKSSSRTVVAPKTKTISKIASLFRRG